MKHKYVDRVSVQTATTCHLYWVLQKKKLCNIAKIQIIDRRIKIVPYLNKSLEELVKEGGG